MYWYMSNIPHHIDRGTYPKVVPLGNGGNKTMPNRVSKNTDGKTIQDDV